MSRPKHHVDVDALAERALADHLETAAAVETDVLGCVRVEGAGSPGSVADRQVVVEQPAAEPLSVQVRIGRNRVEVPVCSVLGFSDAISSSPALISPARSP